LPTPELSKALHTDAYDGARSGYFAKVDTKMRRSRHRLRLLRKYVSGRRFLDVGCSGGFMVEAAREAGYEATGLDIDVVSIDYAREHFPEIALFNRTVEEFRALYSGKFDLIYCSEVIEHVPQPRPFMSAIAELLAPGGILFITTPDISHWRVPKDIRTWIGFAPPAHCVYFTPDSLIRLIEDVGLRLIRRRWAFKPGIKLICGKK
jgi:2-polyprenyl-3-methyl-5-hydroxy-6-metoxy-1,4-benzoquinol methylase